MANEYKQNGIPEDDEWLKQFLRRKGVSNEQLAQQDELVQTDELELERIVQQTLADDWGITADAQENPEDLTQRFANPEQETAEEVSEQEEEFDEAPEKKKKPKKKKGDGLFGIPHLLSSFVWLAVILVVGISIGRLAWVCFTDLLAFGKEPKQVTITITESDDLQSIAEKLEMMDMIEYPGLFKLFAQLTGKGEDISTGTFTFSGDTVYDYNALIKAMIDYGPEQGVVEITFPEGYNCAQIYELLEKKGVCSVADLEAYAANGELSEYWFLNGVKRGHKYSLEGFLAPDTYKFYTNDEPRRVLEKFLDEFDSRIDERLKEQFTQLNVKLAEKMRRNGYGMSTIADSQLTFYDVVILASIIEKETSGNVESFQIASVFINRLADPSDFPCLESDATIDYAINYYNKGELITDAQINASPFQSYVHKGLIPSPITNPGLNSLGAALSPADTGYYYFVLDKEEGHHVFSKTLREHLANLDRLGY